jgi:MerR family redox-sensitive transcriptional activator SoxR
MSHGLGIPLARVRAALRLRDNLADCIGCGCLSLRSCALFNPEDVLADHGPVAARL